MDRIGVDRRDPAGGQDPAGIDPANNAESRPGALRRVGDGAHSTVLRERLARLLGLGALAVEGLRLVRGGR